MYCKGFDSLKFIPKKGVDSIFWIINENQDTMFSDTLVLHNGYDGIIGFQSSGGEICLLVFPFKISSKGDKTIFCGDTTLLEIASNYYGEGIPSYSWSPGLQLNDSTIQSPCATVKSETSFKITTLTPEGCQSIDSVKVYISPMNHPIICNVSVNNELDNVITIEKPISESISSFNIYRETDIVDVYQNIGYVYYRYGSYTDVDRDVNSNMYSYKYKISIVDDCGIESERSPYHKTMVLDLNYEQDNILNLTWEPYEGFEVSYYNLYKRKIPNTLVEIIKLDIGKIQYKDTLSPDNRYFFYQVEAVDTNYNPNCLNEENIYNSSFSNIATNFYTGINDFLTNSDCILVYPNPTNDEFIIETKNLNDLEGTVEVLNSSGQILKKLYLNHNKTIINMDNFGIGLYLLKIRTNKGIVTKTIAKK
jgi:hypothetical protein